MFILPWKTDAPIYHYPIVTVAMIVINTITFVFMVGDPAFGKDLALEHGNGLHPWQWLTANFAHAGIFHLVGNMVFLWVFGLVVEGKLGWMRFLVVYLGIGIVQNALVQIVMLGAPEITYSLGASSIIFGLLAMAMIWAPLNQITCIFVFMIFLFVRVFFFEVTILTMAMCYIGLELFTGWWEDFLMSSAMLHLAGVSFGLPLGIAMLKLGWVDCEHWDLFSVWAGRHKMTRAQREQQDYDSEEHQEKIRQKKEEAAEQMKKLLGQGNALVALAFYRKTVHMLGSWELPDDLLLLLIAGLDKQKAYVEAMPWMKEYVRRFPEKGTKVRLKMAQILIRHERQPGRALGMLEKMDSQAMPEGLRQAWQALRKEATAMKNEEKDELGLMADEDDF